MRIASISRYMWEIKTASPNEYLVKRNTISVIVTLVSCKVLTIASEVYTTSKHGVLLVVSYSYHENDTFRI